MRMLTGPGASTPSIHEALSFFSWMLILVFLAVEFRHRLHVLGSFIVPLALVSLVSAALPETVPTLQPVFRTLWVHVTLSMLGTVGFAVAFVAGVMYLIQDGLLKSKRFNVLYSKLPALDFLDDLNQQSIVLGFPLLTLGIITGAISAEFARGTCVNGIRNRPGRWLAVLLLRTRRAAHGRMACQTRRLFDDYWIRRSGADAGRRGHEASKWSHEMTQKLSTCILAS